MEETKKKISKAHIGRTSIRKGTQCSAETREKLKEYMQEKNSQFGSIWITDGNTNMKIRKDKDMPLGWNKGRTFKKEYNRVWN